MSTSQINTVKLILTFLVTLTIGACVSTTSEEDEEAREEAEKKLRAELWLSPDCLRDNAGQYYRGLYKFKDDGDIVRGNQQYQDASCSTQNGETVQLSTYSGTYAVVDTETLEDGTDGFSFDYSIGNLNVLAYFRQTNSNTLCFSNNLKFGAEKIHLETDTIDPGVDYQNCMTAYRSSEDNDPNPNPNPNPNPDPNPNSNETLQGVWVLSTQCRVNDAGNHFHWLLDFTKNSRVLEAYAFFDNNNCSGTTQASDFSDINLTYTDFGAATLPDGRSGYRMQLSQGTSSFEGYYTFDAQNRLCISHSFTLTQTDNSSTDIDYNNCFSRP